MGKSKRPPIDYAEWHECEFRDSEAYDGKYWPKTQIHPLSLAANQTYPIQFIGECVVTMYVTVLSGVLSLWFRSVAANPVPGGDQAHMEFVSDEGPREVIFPPGEFRLTVGAANSAACVASIVLLEREAHK